MCCCVESVFCCFYGSGGGIALKYCGCVVCIAGLAYGKYCTICFGKVLFEESELVVL